MRSRPTAAMSRSSSEPNGLSCTRYVQVALGRTIAELIVPPSLRERHIAAFARFVKTREASMLGRRVELTGMRADGSEFPVELALSQVEAEAIRFSHACARMVGPLRIPLARIRRIEPVHGTSALRTSDRDPNRDAPRSALRHGGVTRLGGVLSGTGSHS